MTTQNYYIESAENPIELAEKNLLFYKEFVASCGCSRYHIHLWPGQTLSLFINSFFLYYTKSGNVATINKGKLLLQQYSEIYKSLTGYPFSISLQNPAITNS